MSVLTFLVSVAYDPWAVSAASTGRWLTMAAGTSAVLWPIRVTPGPGHWWGAALVVWAAASLAWSPSPVDGVLEVAQLVVLAGVFCCAAAATDGRGIAVGLGAACMVQGLFVLLQIGGVGDAVLRASSVAPGLFLNKDSAAEFGAAAFVLIMVSRLWAFAPAAAVCAVLPGSHAAYLALGAAAFMWGWPRVGQRLRVVGAAALPVVLGALLWAEWDHLQIRLDIWGTLLLTLTIFGRGAGSLGALFPNLEYAHDWYLELVFEYGAGALAVGGILAHALRSRLEGERLALVALLVCAVFGFVYAPVSWFLVALLAGRLCGDCDRVLRAGRVGRVSGAPGADLSGTDAVGASVAPDLGRRGVPIRPQPAPRSRAVLDEFREGSTA